MHDIPGSISDQDHVIPKTIKDGTGSSIAEGFKED